MSGIEPSGPAPIEEPLEREPSTILPEPGEPIPEEKPLDTEVVEDPPDEKPEDDGA